jgi:hypothetical protein
MKKDKLEALKLSTLRIMKELDIQIRSAIDKDGELEIKIDSKLWRYNAEFSIKSDKDGIRFTHDNLKQHYIDPIISTSLYISQSLNADFHYDHVRACSIMVHEITHYYDASLYDEEYIYPNGYNYEDYISQKCELNAHAVQAYYYLETAFPEKLKDIISRNNLNDIKRLSINEYNLLTEIQRD